MTARRERFVTTKHFLDSARSIDITIEEAVFEIVDNAFDADARNIRIDVEKNKQGFLRMTFSDDGVGIPASHIDKDGIEHEGIPYVLAYGGRIPHPGQPHSIGKFGWGLSQAASALSRRTEVYSKTINDEQWRHSWYDFTELEKEPLCELPEERFKNPPWLTTDSGTIIILDSMDGADFKQPGHVVNMLERSLGQTYRKFIGDGRTITVTQDGRTKKVKSTQIKISDPLHQMPNSEEVKTFGISHGPYDVNIRFDGESGNTIGKIIDPRTGQPAEIQIRMVRIDAENLRTKLGLPANTPANNKLLREWGFRDEDQGFSILRNGREIRFGERLGLWAQDSDYAYFRAELQFPEVLDKLFNIQVNKSRFTIDHRIQKIIRQRCWPTVRQLVNEHKATVTRRRATVSKQKASMAEAIAATIAPMLPKPKLTPKEKNDAKAEIKKRVEKKIETAKKEGESKITQAKENLETVKKTGDEKRIETAKAAVTVAVEEKTATVEAIRNRFSFDAPCRKEIASLGSGMMYEVEHLGEEVWVTVNMDTPFFRAVYERAMMNGEMESLLDLMIFAMAYAEHMVHDQPSMKEFWVKARSDVSATAHKLVDQMRLEDSQ